MKKSEAKKALAGKSPAELQTELEALLKEQFGLRMQAATQQLTDHSKMQERPPRDRPRAHADAPEGRIMTEEQADRASAEARRRRPARRWSRRSSAAWSATR